MVAEPPGSGTLAAMMLLGAIVAAMLVAMAVCLVYGWKQMRAQEKVVKITETVMDLPTLRIAVRTGSKYHRKGCGHLRNHSCTGNFHSMLGPLHGEGLGHKQKELEREEQPGKLGSLVHGKFYLMRTTTCAP